MDFVPLIDQIGEPQTLALVGFALAFTFGFIAERSGFCTRSAVLDIISKRISGSLPLWLLAFGTAVLSVQLLIVSGMIDVSETRFFSTAQSLSGALVGGALFGVGMALSRGCASRLMILGATGNLRAIATVAVMATFAWATFQGFLVPFRDAVGSLINTTAIGSNAFVSTTASTGIMIGGAIMLGAALLAFRVKLGAVKSAAGLAIGGLVAAGWYATYTLSQQVFDPIQAESLSFIRPSANAVNFTASGASSELLSLDTGLFFGIIAGALISSLLFRSFKIRTFGEEGTPHFAQYLAGGALTGFGGILAVGCTVGAGFTGGSVLAISSLLGLASMMIFSGLTDLVLRKLKTEQPMDPVAIPAE